MRHPPILIFIRLFSIRSIFQPIDKLEVLNYALTQHDGNECWPAVRMRY